MNNKIEIKNILIGNDNINNDSHDCEYFKIIKMSEPKNIIIDGNCFINQKLIRDLNKYLLIILTKTDGTIYKVLPFTRKNKIYHDIKEILYTIYPSEQIDFIINIIPIKDEKSILFIQNK